MTSEEISKEIIVSMIQRGFFDSVDNSETYEKMNTERTNSICKTLSAITKTINQCKGGIYE
jgi:hypothetical protein